MKKGAKKKSQLFYLPFKIKRKAGFFRLTAALPGERGHVVDGHHAAVHAGEHAFEG